MPYSLGKCKILLIASIPLPFYGYLILINLIIFSLEKEGIDSLFHRLLRSCIKIYPYPVVFLSFHNSSCIFGRPYYRSSLWYSMASVRLSVCPSVCNILYCGKTVRLAKNCLKEWIGNQGEKVHIWGRRHISTSGFAATATATAVFALFLPV